MLSTAVSLMADPLYVKIPTIRPNLPNFGGRMREMEVIGVIAKPSRENTRTVLETLLPWLRQRTRTILLDKDTAATVQETSTLSRAEVAQEAQLMLVLGGD